MACGVRNAAGATFLNHMTGGVRDATGDSFTLPGAGCVRHATSDTTIHKVAGRVRHAAVLGFLDHVTGGVRNAAGAAFFNHVASGVRNPLVHSVRNLVTDSVRHAACFHASFEANRAHLFLDDFGAPDLAADRVATMTFFGTVTVRAGVAVVASIGATLIAAAVCTAFSTTVEAAELIHAAAIPMTGRTAAAGNAFTNGFPFATANVHPVSFPNRFADCVADIPIAGFGHSAVLSAAHVLIAGFVNRTAGCVTDVAVAGPCHRSADRVAMIAIAGFVNRLADIAGHRAIAGLVDGSTNLLTNSAVAGFVNRTTDRVSFFTIAGLENGPCAGNWHRFATGIVNRNRTAVFLRVPDDLFDRLILWAAVTFCDAKMAPASTCFNWTAIIAASTAVSGLCRAAECAEHQRDSSE